MGQKVNPHGARVGVILDWSTKWYAGKKDFSNNLIEDHKLRLMLKEKLYQAGISHIDIARTNTRLHVTIFTAKAGHRHRSRRRGRGSDQKRHRQVDGQAVNTVQLDIMEIKHPDTNAQLVAENIAQQLEKRISFRRAMKQTIGRAMKAGAKGIKTSGLRPSGRRGHRPQRGATTRGSIPLQTLRANIDYGFAEAKTTYGRIGVKVWIYKGQVLPKAKRAPAAAAPRRSEGGK